MPISPPRISRISGSDNASRSRPAKVTEPAVIRPGGSRDQPQHRQRGDRLAGAALTDHGHGFPGVNGIADTVNRANDPRTGAKFRVQVADI